jgi:predicted dehydrogenase
MSEKKLRVAIVGTGFGKSVQIPGFRACANAEIYAICASTLEKAQAVQQELGIPHAFTSYRAMLKLPELDLVSIVTPPHLHKSMSVAALRAGKHVLCEKPTAMNLQEARAMWKRAKESKLVALIDHELRMNPARRKIKELIEAKFIGQLRHVQIALAGSFRADASRHWDWWSDKRRGGGILGAIGSHQIDLLRWWFGEVKTAGGRIETFVKERPLPESHKLKRAPCQSDTHRNLWRRGLAAFGRRKTLCRTHRRTFKRNH